MKHLILVLICLSLPAYADFIVDFTKYLPQQVFTNNVPQDKVDTKVFVLALLTSDEVGGIKAAVGYSFFCDGDDPAWANKNQIVYGSSTDRIVGLPFQPDKPNRWDQWGPGSKNCLLTWKASAIRTQTTAGAISFSLTGAYAGISFSYSPSVKGLVDERQRGPVTTPFTMIKPIESPGSFCEDIH